MPEHKPYSNQIHQHNFATWTAARAVARGFISYEHVRDAIEKTDLAKKAQEQSPFPDQVAFDDWHKTTCKAIVSHWNTLKLNSKKSPSFGFAAKVVAIYLKTIVGMRADSKNTLTDQLHPPIDRILLLNLNRKMEKADRWKELPKWTELTFTQYTDILMVLIDFMVKHHKSEPLWMVERYWEAG